MRRHSLKKRENFANCENKLWCCCGVDLDTDRHTRRAIAYTALAQRRAVKMQPKAMLIQRNVLSAATSESHTCIKVAAHRHVLSRLTTYEALSHTGAFIARFLNKPDQHE